MVSEGSLRGMRKRSLVWLSMARSVVAGAPREYRLIVAFNPGAVFGTGRRESNREGERGIGQVGRAWQAREEGEGGGGGVGMWESGKLDAVERRLFVSLWMRGGSGGGAGN